MFGTMKIKLVVLLIYFSFTESVTTPGKLLIKAVNYRDQRVVPMVSSSILESYSGAQNYVACGRMCMFRNSRCASINYCSVAGSNSICELLEVSVPSGLDVTYSSVPAPGCEVWFMRLPDAVPASIDVPVPSPIAVQVPSPSDSTVMITTSSGTTLHVSASTSNTTPMSTITSSTTVLESTVTGSTAMIPITTSTAIVPSTATASTTVTVPTTTGATVSESISTSSTALVPTSTSTTVSPSTAMGSTSMVPTTGNTSVFVPTTMGSTVPTLITTAATKVCSYNLTTSDQYSFANCSTNILPGCTTQNTTACVACTRTCYEHYLRFKTGVSYQATIWPNGTLSSGLLAICHENRSTMIVKRFLLPNTGVFRTDVKVEFDVVNLIVKRNVYSLLVFNLANTSLLFSRSLYYIDCFEPDGTLSLTLNPGSPNDVLGLNGNPLVRAKFINDSNVNIFCGPFWLLPSGNLSCPGGDRIRVWGRLVFNTTVNATIDSGMSRFGLSAGDFVRTADIFLASPN